MTQPQQPKTTVVEWGPEVADGPPGRFWRDPRIGWIPAGLGGAALFGSFTGRWQTTEAPEDLGELPMVAGLAALGPLGTGWVLGGMLLASCAGLTLVGQPVIRPFARTAGLVLATVLTGVLLAITTYVGEPVAYRSVGLTLDGDYEVTLGQGFYLAYAALALIAAALWLARPAHVPESAAWPAGRNAAPPAPAPRTPPSASPVPGELTVGPAEPFTHPPDDHEWR